MIRLANIHNLTKLTKLTKFGKNDFKNLYIFVNKAIIQMITSFYFKIKVKKCYFNYEMMKIFKKT